MEPGIRGLIARWTRQERNLERAGVLRSVAMKPTGYKTENVYRRYAIVSESESVGGGEEPGGSARPRFNDGTDRSSASGSEVAQSCHNRRFFGKRSLGRGFRKRVIRLVPGLGLEPR